MTVEAKSQDRPFVSWRPRKANGVIQSKYESLRTRGVDGIIPSLRAEED